LNEPIGQEQEYSMEDRLIDERPSPEDECRTSELAARVSKLARRLSPPLRRTFQLRGIEDLSIRETAGILGVVNGTVKAQFARARKKLRESMRSERRSQARGLRTCKRSPSMAGD
jgi:RNA polymerase sigma-70 factor (ECF subfamily)